MSAISMEQLFRSQQYQQISSGQIEEVFRRQNLTFFDGKFARKFIYEILRDDPCSLDDIVSACKVFGGTIVGVSILQDLHNKLLCKAFLPMKIEKEMSMINTFTLIRSILDSESISLHDLVEKCKEYSLQTVDMRLLHVVRFEIFRENEKRPVVFHYDDIPVESSDELTALRSIIKEISSGECERSKTFNVEEFNKGVDAMKKEAKKQNRKTFLTLVACLFCFPCFVCARKCC